MGEKYRDYQENRTGIGKRNLHYWEAQNGELQKTFESRGFLEQLTAGSGQKKRGEMVLACSKGFRSRSRERLGVIVSIKNEMLNLAFKGRKSHGVEAMSRSWLKRVTSG